MKPATSFATLLKFGAATQIVVTQFDPNEKHARGGNGKGRLKVINRVEIPASERTYDLAVQRVIQLHDQYRPTHIYADRGAGEYLPFSEEVVNSGNHERGNSVKGHCPNTERAVIIGLCNA